MRDSKFTKILLIILVIVCVFQGCSISAMNATIEDLNNNLIQSNSTLQNLQYRLAEVEDVIENNSIQMDYFYEISKIDWNAGIVQTDFTINLVSATENTRIVIGNGYGTFELSKNGNTFKGTVEYPMNANEYETMVYQYEGDTEKNHETIGWISAGSLLSEKIVCKFDGYTSYGNGKLTVAGDLHYGFYLEEKIASLRFVVGDTSTEVENKKTGIASVNVSEYIGTVEDNDSESFRAAYLEFVSESGSVYRVYPEIFAGANYKVNKGEEIVGSDIYQDNWLMVSLPDGTEYEMILNEYTDVYVYE